MKKLSFFSMKLGIQKIVEDLKDVNHLATERNSQNQRIALHMNEIMKRL